MRLDQIVKFENLNPTISIGVLAYDEVGRSNRKSLFSVYMSKHLNRKHVNLLLLTAQDPITDEPIRRYIVISDLSRLHNHAKE